MNWSGTNAGGLRSSPAWEERGSNAVKEGREERNYILYIYRTSICLSICLYQVSKLCVTQWMHGVYRTVPHQCWPVTWPCHMYTVSTVSWSISPMWESMLSGWLTLRPCLSYWAVALTGSGRTEVEGWQSQQGAADCFLTSLFVYSSSQCWEDHGVHLHSFINAFLDAAANDRWGHGASLCVTKYRPPHRRWKNSSDSLHCFPVLSVKFCSVEFRLDTESLFLVLGAAASSESSWMLKVQGTGFIY